MLSSLLLLSNIIAAASSHVGIGARTVVRVVSVSGVIDVGVDGVIDVGARVVGPEQVCNCWSLARVVAQMLAILGLFSRK